MSTKETVFPLTYFFDIIRVINLAFYTICLLQNIYNKRYNLITVSVYLNKQIMNNEKKIMNKFQMSSIYCLKKKVKEVEINAEQRNDYIQPTLIYKFYFLN